VTDGRVKSQYTGIVVTYAGKEDSAIYNRKQVEVVDGQQAVTISVTHQGLFWSSFVCGTPSTSKTTFSPFLL